MKSFTYTVFRTSENKTSTTVTLKDGSTMLADLPVVETELVPDDAHNGTIVLRMPGVLAEVQELFAVGTKINATFSILES